jgi:hypothetical protein
MQNTDGKGSPKIPASSEEQNGIRRARKAQQKRQKSSHATANPYVSDRELIRQEVVEVHIEMLQQAAPVLVPQPPEEQKIFLDAFLVAYRKMSFADLHVGTKFSPLQAIIAEVERKLDQKDLQRHRDNWIHAQARFRQAWQAAPYRDARRSYDEDVQQELARRLINVA